MQPLMSELNIVGLPTDKALAILKLHRKVLDISTEHDNMQRDLIDKYAIPIVDGHKLDEKSENYKEYSEAYDAFVNETVNLDEYCVLTEEESFIAVSKVKAPMMTLDLLAKFLTKETENN